MCVLCEAAGQAAEFSVTSRPAHRLAGLWWRGVGHLPDRLDLEPTIARVAAFSATRTSIWKSPLVGILRQAPGSCSYFIGVDLGEAPEIPSDFVFFDAPEMDLVSVWHGPTHGLVEDRYLAMADWLRAHGYTASSAICERREEYPHDTDGSSQSGFRLMIPVYRQFD